MTLPVFSPVTDPATESWLFWCPGCECAHRVVTKALDKYSGPVWDWNQDVDKPTIKPSIRTVGKEKCHIYITDGKIQFLEDCSHSKIGQTVDMTPL